MIPKKFAFCFVLLAIAVQAQTPSLRQIMEDPAWIGALPQNLTLSPLEKAIYFQITQPIPEPAQWKRYDLESGALTEVDDAHRPYASAGRDYARGEVRIVQVGGDLWISRKGGALEPLLALNGYTGFHKFLDDHRIVISQRDNFLVYDMRDGSLQQVTDLATRTKSEDKETFYTIEERKMFRYIDNQYKSDDYREAQGEDRRRMGPLTKPATAYLGKGYEIADADLSDDMTYVAAALSPENEGERTDYAEFINKEGNVTAKKARPRVGYAVKTWKLAIIERLSGEVKWVDIESLSEIATDRMAEIHAEQSEEDQELAPKTKEGPRPVRFVIGGFKPGGGELLVSAYSRDWKDRWVMLVDPATLEVTEVDHHYDPAWILYFTRNAGHNDRFVTDAAFWRNDGSKVMYLSDQSGHQHLYAYNPQSKQTDMLTKGDFEIYTPFESEDGSRWYFHANKTHPGERHFYSMPIDGGDWTAYTKEVGQHSVGVSPDGSWMAALLGRTNRPPVVRVKMGDGAWKEIYDGRSDEFKGFDWVEPQVITYKNRSGDDVYTRLYKPKNPNGAAVIFVHGAGYLQNAHKGWSGYFREYMFHNLLLSKGYTVLDPDFQASSGYGRDWRTAIYRHMGGADLNDIIDGAKFLASEHGVDAKRVGVYGGSYGGFISLMAMFTAADTFRSGAALRPVTDWAYYNHWYTSRILNTPTSDPLAYRRSSPIYFADGLKGDLLIAHGMVDDNVHFQDSVRLAQKLIELRKHHWELASYPVEPHGFRTPSGWYDEYRRIYELFERTLQ